MTYSPENFSLFFFVLFVIAIISLNVKGSQRKYAVFVQAALSALFFGLRDASIGADTYTYMNIYIHEMEYQEIAFVLLAKLIRVFAGDDWRVFMVVVSLLYNMNLASVCVLALRESRASKYAAFAFPCMLFMPYVLLMQVNIIRQGLALSLLLNGIMLWHCRRSKKAAVALMTAGCLTHYSLAVALAGFVLALKLKLRHDIMLAGIVVGLFLSFANISSLIFQISPVDYIRNAFAGYRDSVTGNISILIKYLFYIVNYCAAVGLSRRSGSSCPNPLVRLFGLLLLSASFLCKQPLISSRILLNADPIIPLLYFGFAGAFKETKLYILIAALAFAAYFLYFLSGVAFKSNFVT